MGAEGRAEEEGERGAFCGGRGVAINRLYLYIRSSPHFPCNFVLQKRSALHPSVCMCECSAKIEWKFYRRQAMQGVK